MTVQTVRLTFSFEPGKEGNHREPREFWGSPMTRQWFKERKSTLYTGKQVPNEYVEITSWVKPSNLPAEERVMAQYPYAYHVNRTTISFNEK